MSLKNSFFLGFFFIVVDVETACCPQCATIPPFVGFGAGTLLPSHDDDPAAHTYDRSAQIGKWSDGKIDEGMPPPSLASTAGSGSGCTYDVVKASECIT